MSNTRVRFKKFNMKAEVQKLMGQEPPYPVYQFSRRIRFERPEVPGTEYRWARDNPP